MAHNFDVHTRTIHTITVTVPDDVLAQIDPSDLTEVEVVLVSRNGGTTRKRLTYRDLRGLLDGDINTRAKRML